MIPAGKCLVVLVGPSGAGKSYFCEEHFPAREIVSSDALREEFTGDFRRQDKNSLVFNEFCHRVQAKLNAGQRVVADATHIKTADRTRTARLGLDLGVPVIYLVINRGWHVKNRDGGWRNKIYVKGEKKLMDAHQMTFEANESRILNGDGIANMVVDTRIDQFEVVNQLPRGSAQFLPELLDRGFEYVRVIGDVHGNLPGLYKALKGRDDRGVTFFLFLGDIVDYGKDTLMTSMIVSKMVSEGEAACIRGNHERKIFNWVLQERTEAGFRGRISHGNDVTTDRVKALAPMNRLLWEESFLTLVELSPDWIQIGEDHLFVHGAAHNRMWDNTIHRANRNSTLESLALFGETTGITDPATGFPERLTNWVDEIQNGKTVVVGHAILSVDKPFIIRGNQGGTAIFLDTGSSKDLEGAPGHLSWLDFDIIQSKKLAPRLALHPVIGSELT